MFKIKSLDILFIFFIFIVLSLGTWQVFRLYSKSKLISDLEDNLKRSSIDFNVDIDKEYTKVLLKKKNLKSKIFLYHLNKGEIGFKVIVPYEVNSSLLVLVDKCWIRKDKINSLKTTEPLFKLFSKSEINLLFECNLNTCHVPKERTINIKNIKNISNDLILNKTVY